MLGEIMEMDGGGRVFDQFTTEVTHDAETRSVEQLLTLALEVYFLHA